MPARIPKICFLALPAALLFLASCDKDDPVQAGGTVSLQLTHIGGAVPLQLDSSAHTTAHGDTFTVSSLLYYLSNVKLRQQITDKYMERESYHLIDEQKPASRSITLKDIPAGTYDKLVFGIGVDNNRNHSGQQTGDLDPALGMIWVWESGYKFLVLEGRSPQSRSASKAILFHLGEDAAYRTVVLPLPAPLVVTDGSRHTLHSEQISASFSAAPGAILTSAALLPTRVTIPLRPRSQTAFSGPLW